MIKNMMNIIIYEVLYLLAIVFSCGIGCLITLVGRKHTGETGGFFEGKVYEYNYFMYLLGTVFVIAVIYVMYKIILVKHLYMLQELGIAARIIFLIIALLFSVGIFFMNMIIIFLMLGFGDDIQPDYLAMIIVLGWPIMVAGIMCLISFMPYDVKQNTIKVEVNNEPNTK